MSAWGHRRAAIPEKYARNNGASCIDNGNMHAVCQGHTDNTDRCGASESSTHQKWYKTAEQKTDKYHNLRERKQRCIVYDKRDGAACTPYGRNAAYQYKNYQNIFYGKNAAEGIAEHIFPRFTFNKAEGEEKRIAEYQRI